ncbi:MAG: type II toxin-antitoxin system prevent-host-death family antitoxin [Micrococcales bacterium]|nr:type II toxin-antitoxin system prevent-host-death family antitoxin [Micrococcales bacterium]
MPVSAWDPHTISQRELRNHSAAIMDRLEAGERFTVTRDGRPVGELVPIVGPREGVPTRELLAAFANQPHVDYHAMRAEMDEFFGDDDALV